MTDKSKAKIYSVTVERLIPMVSEYHVETEDKEAMLAEMEESLKEEDCNSTIMGCEVLVEDASKYEEVIQQRIKDEEAKQESAQIIPFAPTTIQ